jgi:hypothetical protein
MAPLGDVVMASIWKTAKQPGMLSGISLRSFPMLATLFPTLPVAKPQAKQQRFDIYGPIHKALRHCMADTLIKLGTLDPHNAAEKKLVLDDLDALLATMIGHLKHENDFIHKAIEARRPGGAQRTAEDHAEHLDSIASLEDESRALRNASPEQSMEFAQRLYSHLAVFVGENYIHMLVEETQNNALLWALYNDAELEALHDLLLASIPPTEMAEAVRWMALALNIYELTAMFTDMRQKAPAPAFEAMLDVAQRRMPTPRWAALARSLGLPPVPGLITY